MASVAAALSLCLFSTANAQEGPPPQGVSRGENFSAKPPAQLFASDCTGAGCHKGPQGLAKNAGIGGLAGFLREHYTNSRESAAALASYLAKLPSGPEPKEARTPRTGRAAAAPPANEPGWAEKLGVSAPSEAAPAQKREPKEREARTPKQNGRTRAAVRGGDDEPAATPPAIQARPEQPAAEAPADAPPKAKETTREPAKESARAQRGHQPTAAIAAPPSEPAPAAEAAPAASSTPPASKQYDIFD